jgi:hypothetical protein
VVGSPLSGGIVVSSPLSGGIVVGLPLSGGIVVGLPLSDGIKLLLLSPPVLESMVIFLQQWKVRNATLENKVKLYYYSLP